MSSLIDRFHNLTPEQKRRVHFHLCQFALNQWQDFTASQGPIHYTEMVCGTHQELDKDLPALAFDAAKHETSGDIGKRYLEPITALHDDDLELPEHMEYTYYAIYNLFQKYAELKTVDDWLIVNQAMSAQIDASKWDMHLTQAIDDAIQFN